MGLALGIGLGNLVAERVVEGVGPCHLVAEAEWAMAGRIPLAGHEGSEAIVLRGVCCPGPRRRGARGLAFPAQGPRAVLRRLTLVPK